MSIVLLVDDDPDNRLLFQVWLTVMGHQVITAVSAADALRILSEQGIPDIAIIDIVMDKISGLDLLDHLRRHEPLTAQMPAILLTARELHTDAAAAQTLAAALLKKPVEKQTLEAAINLALHQGAAPQL